MRPQTIGLVAHTGKSGVAELARAVVTGLQEKKIDILVENQTAALAQQPASGTIAQVAARADLIVVLGGDGTILNVVASAGEQLKPIFGINVGSLGFLTGVNSSAYRDAVEAIAAGRIACSQRALLAVELCTKEKAVSSVLALNDAVISRGDLPRLIRLRTIVNGEALTEFNADGLIIATPTGSTAYSLSAGGPILAPDSGVFVITPICPHVLTNRSVIVNDSAQIEVTPARAEGPPVFLSVDGRSPERIPQEGYVKVKRAKMKLELGFLPEISFFGLLRQKLKWSGSNV
jgi:NAD+ kinase